MVVAKAWKRAMRVRICTALSFCALVMASIVICISSILRSLCSLYVRSCLSVDCTAACTACTCFRFRSRNARISDTSRRRPLFWCFRSRTSSTKRQDNVLGHGRRRLHRRRCTCDFLVDIPGQ